MVRLATTAEAALATLAGRAARETADSVTAHDGADADAIDRFDRLDRLHQVNWSRSIVEEGGQHHLVLIPSDDDAPQVVARISRTAAAAAQLPRTVRLLRSLHGSGLPYALPLPLSNPVADPTSQVSNTHRAVVVIQRYIPGQAHPPHTGRVDDLREICRTLAGVDTSVLEPDLAAPFAFRGPWTSAKIDGLLALPQRLDQHLPHTPWPDFFPDCSPDAFPATVHRITETVQRWTVHPEVPPSLVHGDLAGHNMHWLPVPGEDRWRLNGILDWDLACRWDPALNPAYLSMWHGEEKLAQLCRDDDEHRRARVWLAAMALESLYDAGLRLESIAPKKWVRLLTRTLPRLQRAVETLG